MFSEYHDYILNIRNSLIRNGAGLDIDPADDYEKLFYLGEGIGQILWLYNILGMVGDDYALSDTSLPLNVTYEQKIRKRVFEKFCENEVDLRVANKGYNKDEIIDLWGTVKKEEPVGVVEDNENIPAPLKEKLLHMLNKSSKETNSSRIYKDENEKFDDRYISSDDFGDYEWIFEKARDLDCDKNKKENKVNDSGSDAKVEDKNENDSVYIDIDALFNKGEGWVCDMIGYTPVIGRPVVLGENLGGSLNEQKSDEKPTWDDPSDDDWGSDPEDSSESREEEGKEDRDLFDDWNSSDDEQGSEEDSDFGDWSDDETDSSDDEDDFGDWGDDESSKDEGSSDDADPSEKGFDDWGSSESEEDDFGDWGSDDSENDESILDRWADSSTGNAPTGFNSMIEGKDTAKRSLSPEELALEREIARVDESVERVSNLISKGFSTLKKLPKKAMKDIGKTE